MIIVRSVTDSTAIENNFEDDRALEALEYQEMLESEGWTNVQWIHLPGVSFEAYIKSYMKGIGFRGVR